MQVVPAHAQTDPTLSRVRNEVSFPLARKCRRNSPTQDPAPQKKFWVPLFRPRHVNTKMRVQNFGLGT